MYSDKIKQYPQPLGDQVCTVEQEARMILPGIQALFGFQLIAVFNEGFKSSLSSIVQAIHLTALLLVVFAAILVMVPAACHRQANHQISKHFVDLTSKYLAWSMVPLALGTCLDVYLVSRGIFDSIILSSCTSLIIFFLYAWFWFSFSRINVKKLKLYQLIPLQMEKSN